MFLIICNSTYGIKLEGLKIVLFFAKLGRLIGENWDGKAFFLLFYPISKHIPSLLDVDKAKNMNGGYEFGDFEFILLVL